MLNWHETCTLKLEHLEATLSCIKKNTYFKYIHFKMHTLLATNDINNVLLTSATFTINTISTFRTIQNYSRLNISHIRCQNIKNKYQKTLPLKSSNNMAKELVKQSSIRIE